MGQSISLSISPLLGRRLSSAASSSPTAETTDGGLGTAPRPPPDTPLPLPANVESNRPPMDTRRLSVAKTALLEEIEVSRITHRDSAASQSSSASAAAAAMAAKRRQTGSNGDGYATTADTEDVSPAVARTWLLRFPVDIILEFRTGTRAILARHQELELAEMSVVRIDISDTQITEIPAMVFELESLEILVLSRNRKSALSSTTPSTARSHPARYSPHP